MAKTRNTGTSGISNKYTKWIDIDKSISNKPQQLDALKVFVVGMSTSYANWFPRILVNTMEEANVVLFTGGEDINPELYGEQEAYQTYFSPGRDAREVEAYKKALSLGKNMWGTCRGLQLFCAMNGGKLVQHLSHGGQHKIELNDGGSLIVNSLHHQLCYPWNLPSDEYELIGWANELSPMHLGGDSGPMDFPKHAFKDNRIMEPEILFFPKTKCLGVQFHPEMMDDPTVLDYLFNLMKQKFNIKTVETQTEVKF